MLIALVAVGMLLCASMALADWDVMPDTWVAADALGRKLPGYDQVGPPRKDRFVGIFYFTWLAPNNGGPYDMSKLIAANPSEPQWGPMWAFHHWGEPELGYYLSKDPWIIRYHCRMLTDAGVDTLILDVTNAITYTDVYMLICQTFKEIRDGGGKTPQMCFIANSSSDAVVQKLYDEFYSKNLYSDLWFRWQGKPLFLANPDKLSQNLKDFFTFRQSWAWHDPKDWFKDGRDKWTWLDNYPQEPGWHEKGKPEEVSVSVAQHPIANIGRSFHDGKQPDPDNVKTAEGACFAEQAKRALEVDPEFVFITGWNEWVAQRFLNEGGMHMRGKKLKKGESYFVDTLNQEFSRDIEPMKGGHTDNYYYQMIDFIRRYKGVRQPEQPSAPKTIKIGSFSGWAGVKPEFRDHIGDTEHRNSQGFGSAGPYVNKTGRNDFVRMKVTHDAKNVYFYCETKDPITKYTDPNWMLLFIDSDCNPATGWNGYDFLVNYSVLDPKTTTLMRSTNGWDWKPVRNIAYAVKGNKLELAIPRTDIGKAGRPNVVLDFHWADNIQQKDDIIQFAISGDSAPSRRFNYRYGTLPKWK